MAMTLAWSCVRSDLRKHLVALLAHRLLDLVEQRLRHPAGLLM